LNEAERNKKIGGDRIKNIRLLLVLQILTLAAAIVGASAYLIAETNSERGVVKGILYTIVDSSTMIDNQVLKEGDTIYGTKVIKIYPKKVEFEKDGKQWTQRICEHPNPAWEEPEIETKEKSGK
jgi:hypothetical protein